MEYAHKSQLDKPDFALIWRRMFLGEIMKDDPALYKRIVLPLQPVKRRMRW